MAGLVRWALTWLGRALTVVTFLVLAGAVVSAVQQDWGQVGAGLGVALVLSGVTWLLFWLTRMLEPYYPD